MWACSWRCRGGHAVTEMSGNSGSNRGCGGLLAGRFCFFPFLFFLGGGGASERVSDVGDSACQMEVLLLREGCVERGELGYTILGV